MPLQAVSLEGLKCDQAGCVLQDGAIVVVKVMHASSMSRKARQEVRRTMRFCSITMFATHAPVRVCRAYCGKYCKGPKLGPKLGHV